MEGTNSTVRVPDYGRPTTRIQKLEILAPKSEVSHSSQYPSAAMLGIGEVEGARSIDDFNISASLTGKPKPGFGILTLRVQAGSLKVVPQVAAAPSTPPASILESSSGSTQFFFSDDFFAD